jgi:hypothetical protein
MGPFVSRIASQYGRYLHSLEGLKLRRGYTWYCQITMGRMDLLET